MGLVDVLKFVANHPLNRSARRQALGRFVRWQLSSRLLQRPVALPFVNGTSLLTERGMTGATGNWYCGLHEVDDMGFVLHMLAPNDLFVDVGANIGSYTVMAAGAVGASVIAVEPVPTTFKKLLANIAVNGIAGKVEAHCLGLSASSGEIVFTAGLDTMNRVALPGEDLATVSVPVRTLDELTAGLTPRLIKIDVEGHETAVLAGGSDTLSRPSLEAVLMETNGSGAKYGVSDESLMETMRGHGFEPCSYDALKRKISPTLHRSRNTIFIRDRRAAEARCKAAERYSLINGSI